MEERIELFDINLTAFIYDNGDLRLSMSISATEKANFTFEMLDKESDYYNYLAKIRELMKEPAKSMNEISKEFIVQSFNNQNIDNEKVLKNMSEVLEKMLGE